MDRETAAFWDRMAEGWQVPPPLGPAPEDLAWYSECVGRTGQAGRGLWRALVLGVTPDLFRLRWPGDAFVVSVDGSERMLRDVLPRAATTARAVRASWTSLPLCDQGFRLALGDGCHAVLRSLEDARRVTREVRRVLARGALFCTRCFSRPERPWTVDELYADLLGAEKPDLELFRTRLAIAVQGNSDEGAELDAIWRAWDERRTHLTEGFRRCGWPSEPVASIDSWMRKNWTGSHVRHFYASRDQIDAFCAEGFELVGMQSPGYARGELFPRLVMRAR